MIDLSTRIIQRRKELNLSLEDVSEQTKIRPHIIEEIENGNLDVLPSVYIKAFLKTYCTFLNIPLSEIPNDFSQKVEPEINNQIEQSEIEDTKHDETKVSKTSKKKKPVYTDVNPNTPESYKELFKKSSTPKRNINYLNIGIYSTLGVIILILIYFALFYSSENEKKDDSLQKETTLTIKDTSEKKEDSKNLFNYFNKSDSLVLSAEANGESWIRIEIDGKKVDEVLLKPDMKQKWVAKEFFLITQGNVGSVVFKRNGQELAPFGNPGTVAKNIKITADTVLNTNPVIENQQRTKVTRKKKGKKVKLIEPSPIPNSKFLEEKKRDTFRL